MTNNHEANNQSTTKNMNTDKEKITIKRSIFSVGSFFQEIGTIAVFIGIIISMTESFHDWGIKGVYLGYLMIGGVLFIAI